MFPVLLYRYAGWHWIAVPWVPIALVGTAAAFVTGFRNSATYDRLWEARRIWGGIVNTSRSWGILTHDFLLAHGGLVPTECMATRKKLVYRHFAWLTALRYQLREPRPWEHMTVPVNVEFRRRTFRVAELEDSMEEELAALLAPADLAALEGKSNKATQILALQSRHLAALAAANALEANRHVALERLLQDCFDLQGQCERIKNFPYPRQFATINLFFIRIFMFLLPLGVLNEFAKLGGNLVWLTVPFSFVVGWVFNTLERVGEVTENPFEGGPNDVPITALSRTIEIDLREMLGEKDIPPALTPTNRILM